MANTFERTAPRSKRLNQIASILGRTIVEFATETVVLVGGDLVQGNCSELSSDEPNVSGSWYILSTLMCPGGGTCTQHVASRPDDIARHRLLAHAPSSSLPSSSVLADAKKLQPGIAPFCDVLAQVLPSYNPSFPCCNLGQALIKGQAGHGGFTNVTVIEWYIQEMQDESSPLTRFVSANHPGLVDTLITYKDHELLNPTRFPRANDAGLQAIAGAEAEDCCPLSEVHLHMLDSHALPPLSGVLRAERSQPSTSTLPPRAADDRRQRGHREELSTGTPLQVKVVSTMRECWQLHPGRFLFEWQISQVSNDSSVLR